MLQCKLCTPIDTVLVFIHLRRRFPRLNLPWEVYRPLVVLWVTEDVWVSSKVVASDRTNESFKRTMRNAGLTNGDLIVSPGTGRREGRVRLFYSIGRLRVIPVEGRGSQQGWIHLPGDFPNKLRFHGRPSAIAPRNCAHTDGCRDNKCADPTQLWALASGWVMKLKVGTSFSSHRLSARRMGAPDTWRNSPAFYLVIVSLQSRITSGAVYRRPKH
jgi:hypothetical protein